MKSKTSVSNGTGCDVDRLKWCAYTYPVNYWVYNVAQAALIGTSTALGRVALFTVFSEVVGPRRQATQHGFMEMFASLGGLLGPNLVGWAGFPGKERCKR